MKLSVRWWGWLGLMLLTQPVNADSLEHFSKLGWIEPKEPVTFFLQYPDQLKQIYSTYHDRRLWLDLRDGDALEYQLTLIKDAQISPLFDRQLRYLTMYRERKDWYQYDLLATDTLLMYLSYAQQAPVHGMTWFFKLKLNHPLPVPNAQAMFDLNMAIELKHLRALIHDYSPQDDGYRQLVKAHQFLSSIQVASLPLYQQSGVKKLNDPLEDRQHLITRLALANIDVSPVNLAQSDYDNTLVAPIKAFQRMHGLKDDGVIGWSTLKWLNMPMVERKHLLALNAERMRLWPTNKQASIVVNIPAFKMVYWFNGEPAFTSKVIVGRRSRPTPLLHTRLDSLIFNPVWNVPRKIMVEDILPHVQQDKEYLQQNNIDVVQHWHDKEPVDISTIDWQDQQGWQFPYKMRQRAGKDNALGLYKFNTPNRRAIYLHDTPHKNLFDRSRRAYSSGCIRVEDAKAFAEKLMHQPGLVEQPTQEQESLPNQSIALKSHIPVRMIYQTVWYENGELHYRADIYRYDQLDNAQNAF
ncbi:L,D-transpeptidase family protein [Vibrio nitrifigilis]|nr:L,D-transpeptidase family protein [Vibrio nitrifigilis]